jgi:hypothetical protein
MDALGAIAAQVGQSRADFAVGQIKQNAQTEKQIADLLQSAASSVPNSPIKGVNVNISA